MTSKKLYLVVIWCILVSSCILSGCGDNDKPSASISDTQQVYNPGAMDDDDATLNEESPVDGVSSAVARCTTYHSTRMNSGRRLWKINKPPWKYARYASVRFSSGYSVPRVVLAKANRTASGFVCRPGETTKNIIAIWAPRGDKSTAVTVCLK